MGSISEVAVAAVAIVETGGWWGASDGGGAVEGARPSQTSVAGLLAALSRLQLQLLSRRGAGAGVQVALEMWEKSRGAPDAEGEERAALG